MISVALDPLNHFKNKIYCINAASNLIYFTEGPNAKISENMESNYHYHTGWHDSGYASFADGKFKYPGDPDLYPVAKITDGTNEEVYIYPQAIVAVVVNGVLTKWARMD